MSRWKPNYGSLVVANHLLTGDCYQTLGVRPALGRLFTAADDTPDGEKVAVLGYRFWTDHFGGNPAVLGHSIRIAGVPFRIIGVTEPRFQGLLLGYPPSVSAPISQRTSSSLQDPSGRFYWAETIARLRPGATPRELEARLKTEWRRLLDASFPPGFHGKNREELIGMPPVVIPAANGFDYYYRDHFKTPLLCLLAISGLVLLVGCLNLGNLLLARGLEHRRETAIRLAVGASRLDIVRGFLVESSLLIGVGSIVALGFAYIGTRLLLLAFLNAYGRNDLSFTIEMDWRVLLFSGLAALLAIVVFGILPAWQTSSVDAAAALKSSGQSTIGLRARSRRFLISAQVAMTLIILMSTAVFTRSLDELRRNALHFNPGIVLDAQLMPAVLSPHQAPLDPNGAIHYLRDFLNQVRSFPGVEEVSLSSFAPLVSVSYKEDIRRLNPLSQAILQAPAEFVTEGFLHLMRIPLLQGRDFELTETPGSPRTVILSQSVARRLFPRNDALGQHIQFGTEPETRDLQVIGVASDSSLEDPHDRGSGFILLNIWQLPRMADWGNLQVRFSGPEAPLASALRNEIHRAGRQQIFALRTMSEVRDMSLLQERMLSMVGAVYAVLALVLAAVGLFGLLAFFVSTRRAEIAVRIALGARRSDVTRLVVREALLLIGAGILLACRLRSAAFMSFQIRCTASRRSP